jgi:hypothetical protein
MTAVTCPAHKLRPGDVLVQNETELWLRWDRPTLTDVDRLGNGTVVLRWPERGVETAHRYHQHLIFVVERTGHDPRQ